MLITHTSKLRFEERGKRRDGSEEMSREEEGRVLHEQSIMMIDRFRVSSKSREEVELIGNIILGFATRKCIEKPFLLVHTFGAKDRQTTTSASGEERRRMITQHTHYPVEQH